MLPKFNRCFATPGRRVELQTKVVKLDSMSHLIVLNNCYFCMLKTSVVFKILTTPEETTGRYKEC